MVELDIEVTAEDEAGTIVMSNVIAMRNRAPLIASGGGVNAFRIGVQAVARPADLYRRLADFHHGHRRDHV